MTPRTLAFDVDIRESMPASPSARLAVVTAATTAGKRLALSEAWMLGALPRLDGVAVEVAPRWCRLDANLDPCWQRTSVRLAEIAADAHGATLLDVDIDEDVMTAPVGLAIENRALAARIVARASAEQLTQIAPVLLPALHPWALGLDADATAVGLGLLRDACRRIESTPFESGPDARLDDGFDKFVEFPRRVKAIQLGDERTGVTWSRAKGLRWTLETSRPAEDALALEVQGDFGARGEFAAGLPERARRYLASDFRPVRKAQVGSLSFLRLEREIKIPENPLEPHGRKRPHDAVIQMRVDTEGRAVDFEVEIAGLVEEHRYRICVPIPFWPRPSRFATFGGDGGSADEEGPRPAAPLDGRIEFVGPEVRLVLVAHDLVEAELYERRNDVVCAVTLARVPRAAPGVLRRRFRLEVASC